MSTLTNSPAKPGETIIAYIDDSHACVGVVVENSNNTMQRDNELQVLVLGYFVNNPQRGTVFSTPNSLLFPSYLVMKSRYPVPYDFSMEIELCQQRNDTWWKTLDPPCYSNLIARFFQPKYIMELQYIAAAKHILQGGSYSNFKAFHRLSMEEFLKLWAVLFTHFPAQVVGPPKELEEPRTNITYIIDMDSEPPYVTYRYR